MIPSLSLTLFLIPHLVFGFIFSFCFERIRKNQSSFYIEKGLKNVDNDQIKKDMKEGFPEMKSTSTKSQTDYKKRALIRSIVVSAVAIHLMYFGFFRLFSHPLQQQQGSSRTTLANTKNIQYRPKSRPPGFEDATLTPLIDAEETPTYLFYE